MPYASDLLHRAWAGNLPTLRQFHIITGMTPEQAAAVCGVSTETYRRWRCDRTPNPAAVRLLAVLAGYVPWRGWEGWEMHSGLLFPPGYSRHGIAPSDILALPFTLQLLSEVQRQAKVTRSERAPVLPVQGRSL